jgi:hypothetical protein
MDLVGKIYQYARKSGELEGVRTHDPRLFRASEAGDCARQIALKKLNTPVEREDDAISMLRLGDGHMHHNHLREIISKLPGVSLSHVEADETLFVELEGYPPIIITGHCDGVVHDHNNGGGKAVLEVKGLNRFTAQKMKSEDLDTLKEGYPKAIPQARVYMAMHDVPKAIILIKSKDTSELKQFTLEHDDKKLMKIVTRFASIARDVMNSEAPPCDYLSGDKRCNYCPFPSKCGR